MENPFKTERFSPLPESSVKEIYRHPHIELPVDPKDFACFLDREHGTLKLRTLPYHHRSADLGVTTTVRERRRGQEQVYCQFDLKGIGFLYPEGHESKKHGMAKGALAGYPEAHLMVDSKETPWGYDGFGLMDERMALNTAAIADRLASLGIRTEAIAAILRLQSLNIGGESVSTRSFIEEGKQTIKTFAENAETPQERKRYQAMAKDFATEFHPVIAVRLMRSVFRLRDLGDTPPEEMRFLIEEACSALNHEAEALGQPERYDASTNEGRAEWLGRIAETIGKNVGILHGEGIVHQYLHMGNLTLAGEIVDLDSVVQIVHSVSYRGDPEKKKEALKKPRTVKDQFGFPSVAEHLDQLDYVEETPEGWIFLDPALDWRRKDEEFGIPACLVHDMRDVCFSFRQIIKSLPDFLHGGFSVDRAAVAERMIRGYEQGFASKDPLKALGVPREQILSVFKQLADKIVHQGKKVSPILNDIKARAGANAR